ncbi:hypothetical protein ACZ87_01791, partial [Candidatus Erwinia dacicola]
MHPYPFPHAVLHLGHVERMLACGTCAMGVRR